jgi:pyruvate formate lyase activating enzyme
MDSEPEPTGIIYDIQGFSVQDGPGIRTTVFLKGCPLRCPWCHSPESQRFDVQLSWQARKCVGIDECGLCLDCCPHGAITPSGDLLDTPGAGRPARPVAIDWEECDDCGLCAEKCPAAALSLWGKRYTVQEVVERAVRDRPFFERSGGGVTVSGGEPLSQAAFTLALLRALKDQGLHTALDTTGCAPWAVVEKTLPFTDLYLLDLKSLDSEAHRTVVGVPNALILENARRLAAGGAALQVRIPLIPRFNDTADSLRRSGEFIASLGEAVRLVQLLPYHAMGVSKWERIRPEGPVLEASAPAENAVEEARAILEECGLAVQVH